MKIFLSYAAADRALAEQVRLLLVQAGHQVFFDCTSLSPSEDYSESVRAAVDDSEIVILLVSPDSIAPNSSALTELEYARARQRSGKLRLLPVRLRDTPWDNIPTELKRFHFLDPQGDLAAAVLAAVSRGEATTVRHAPSMSAPGSMLGGIVTTMRDAIGSVRKKLGFGQRAKPPSAVLEPNGDNGAVLPTGASPEPKDAALAEPVLLGVAAPRKAVPGSSFTARFAAYLAAAAKLAESHLKDLGEDGDRIVTDIGPDRAARWRVGAPVTVRLSGDHMRFTPAERSFEWNGKENLVSFAVTVDSDAQPGNLLLCFHVLLGGMEISFISLVVAVGGDAKGSAVQHCTASMPSSAFASYSSKDAEAVSRSLSTLTRWAPTLDIFQDCLDLKANEAFKPQLEAEIGEREVFLLFWSRNARQSKWVLWEYETARAKHGLKAVLPMPLEDPAIAPPPAGFEEQHMRDRFMIAGYGLKKIAEELNSRRKI